MRATGVFAFKKPVWMLLIAGSSLLGNELSCVSELLVPVYPPVARNAGLNGKIDLVFQLEPGGAVAKVAIVNSPKAFDAAAKLLAQKVKFTSDCSAQQVHITILFEIDPNAERDQSSAHMVKFIAPGTFVVKAPLATMNVTNTGLLEKGR